MPLIIEIATGFDATVKVPSIRSAILFLGTCKDAAPESASGPASQQPANNQEAPPDDGDPHPFGDVAESSLREALNLFRGTDSAKIIKAIADSRNHTASDRMIRQHIGWEEDYNLGPLFSHISKVCTKVQIERKNLLLRKVQRTGKAGERISEYWYKLNPKAAAIVSSSPNYAKQTSEPFDLEVDA